MINFQRSIFILSLPVFIFLFLSKAFTDVGITQKGTNLDSNYSVSQSDTSNANNRIDRIWSPNNFDYHIKIKLENYDQQINLSVYNMLGKKVEEVHDGVAMSEDFEYIVKSASIPNGIYICILQGNNFKDAEKFIVSR